jgi:signal transduction histidine kinase
VNKDSTGRVRFWHSLHFRVALSYLGIITFLLAMVNLYPMVAMENLIFHNKETTLQNQVSMMTTNLAELEELNAEGVAQVMEILVDNSLTRVVVTDSAGLILYDTASHDGTQPQYALFQEVELALSGQNVFQSAYEQGAFRSGAAAPVVYRNVVIGAVYIYVYDSVQAEMLQSLQDNLWKGSVFFFVLSVLFSTFLSHQMTGGIRRLMHAMEELREGGYHSRAEVRGKDELAVLAQEYNVLAQRLEETEEARRRFVADASHELKTPLASIRLLADSILQSDEIDVETAKEFVADIGSEAERLSRITEALLVLTRMDSRKEVPVSVIDLRDSISDTARVLEPVAREQRVSIELILGEPCLVRANGDDIYHILLNLMENAIKYNVPNGTVTVSICKEEDTVRLLVEDTGIGIPEEDREKVFERFFRVDKARSRAAGGTGLGLSIVQDAVHRWGGEITLGPGEERGTWFQVTFPAAEEEMT